MQRVIKFRVWDKLNNKLYSWRIDVNYYLDGNGQTSNDFILSQFTGLFDKNGKEIYEGDIIKWSSWDKDTSFAKETTKKRHIVEWSNDKGCWFIEKDVWNLGIYSDIEIIGNIYSTPQLLNNEQPETKSH
jgi:uncharacterized phage protein (TIGR01671 family)